MASNDVEWADLINGLGLLRLGKYPDTSPTYCDSDVLTVMSDPERFTPDQIAQLERLGFHADRRNGTFYSHRFGSE